MHDINTLHIDLIIKCIFKYMMYLRAPDFKYLLFEF